MIHRPAVVWVVLPLFLPVVGACGVGCQSGFVLSCQNGVLVPLAVSGLSERILVCVLFGPVRLLVVVVCRLGSWYVSAMGRRWSRGCRCRCPLPLG